MPTETNDALLLRFGLQANSILLIYCYIRQAGALYFRDDLPATYGGEVTSFPAPTMEFKVFFFYTKMFKYLLELIIIIMI